VQKNHKKKTMTTANFLFVLVILTLALTTLAVPTVGPSDEPASPDSQFVGSDKSTWCRLCTIDCAAYPYFYGGISYDSLKAGSFSLDVKLATIANSTLQCAHR